MGLFFGAVGAAILVALLGYFLKFSFGVGFIVWLVIVGIGAYVESQEAEEKKKDANTKKCSACAEPILKEARKCKHCGEAQ